MPRSFERDGKEEDSMDEQKGKKSSARAARLLNLLALALAAAACAPFVIAARYALFHGDDFSSTRATFAAPAEHLLRAVAEKFDLAPDWDDRLGGALAHIVVMQHVTKELLDILLAELSK